jgi:hypothetical protein
LNAFEGTDIGTDPEDPMALIRLRQWSRSHLDSRGGRERHEARPYEYTPEQIRALQEASGPLGLLQTAGPVDRSYGLTIVLGGTVAGNEVRTSHAVELQATGIDLGKLVAAGGYRPLSPPERTAAVESGAPPAAQQAEYEHLAWVLGRRTSATGRRLIRSEGEARKFSSWRIEALERDGVPVAYVVQAPSRRPERRADTLDAVLFTRQELGADAARTLVVTSSMYTPYSYFLLAPHATPDRPIEVVGTPTTQGGKPSVRAQRFAQEIHSTLSVLPA